MSSKELVLSRNELDSMENDPIFTMWLFGNIDEANLSENQKRIIVARQMYYDLLLKDEEVISVLRHINCNSYEQLINDPELINSAARFLSVKNDVLLTKIELMKVRKEKSEEKKNTAVLNLKKEN